MHVNMVYIDIFAWPLYIFNILVICGLCISSTYIYIYVYTCCKINYASL